MPDARRGRKVEYPGGHVLSAQSRGVVPLESQSADRPEHRSEGRVQVHEPSGSALQNAGVGTDRHCGLPEQHYADTNTQPGKQAGTITYSFHHGTP